MNYKTIGVFIVLLCAGVVSASDDFFANIMLINPAPDKAWQKLYDEISGSTHEEKSHNAMTTWEMKAVSEISLCRADLEMLKAVRLLYDKLDQAGKQQLVDTHQAWKAHIKLQAEFVTADCKGGSAHSLYLRSVLIHELKRQTLLYQEKVEGRSICVGDGLSIYK